MKLQLVMLAALVFVVSAGEGLHGILEDLHNKLSEEQRQQARKIIEDNQNGPRSQIKEALNTFISGLSPELQSEVASANATFYQKVQENAQKVQSLSPEAQALYNQVADVAKNDGLSVKQEQEQVEQIYQGANQQVVQELKNSGVFLPGQKGTGNPLTIN